MTHWTPFLFVVACASPVDAPPPTTTEGATPTDTQPVDTGSAPPACRAVAWTPPPACGTGPVARAALFPGPATAGHDAALAAKAHDIDRLFHALIADVTGVNSEIRVPRTNTAARSAIDAFLAGDGWDLAAVAGTSVPELVEGGGWTKVAGGYAGVGIAADAMRYGVLRDEGAPCEEVDRARTLLLRSLDGLHRASAITGVPGVIARGYARIDVPGDGAVYAADLTPLADAEGRPLPLEKDNGTWRADNSGLYPDYAWEDSCSRDMFMGWVTGFGFAWEVVGRDPSIPEAVKETLRADAAALIDTLRTVQESGFDLEIRDADGRRTFHGILHEESIDTFYTPGNAVNGSNALMALGAVAALASIVDDADVDAWIADELIAARDLPGIAERTVGLLNANTKSNYSGHNMAYLGTLLAQRYLCDDEARATVARAGGVVLYGEPGTRTPQEQQQSLYDVVTALARAGAWAGGDATAPVDAAILANGLASLTGYPAPPYDDDAVENCDADEIASTVCVGIDGTPITVLGEVGRNDLLVAAAPLPMSIRPPSNYFWRSDPYRINADGTGDTLYPGVDFRFVYWLGRWATTEARD